MDYQIVLEKLPSKWEDVSLKKALNYLSVEFQLPVDDEMENIEIGLDNIFKTISVLTEVPLEEVKTVPKIWIDRMAVKTQFMNKQPEPNKKSVIEWKNVDEVTYDDFITYSQLQGVEVIEKMPTLIKSFSKNKMTEEEILNLNIVEINTGFFLLRRQLAKFSKGMIQSSRKLLRKQRLRDRLQEQQRIREKLPVKN